MMKNIRYYVPGGLVMAAGLLILAFPEILVVIVAAFIMLIGLLALYMGHRVRQVDGELKGPEAGCDHRWRFFRVPTDRRWYGDF